MKAILKSAVAAVVLLLLFIAASLCSYSLSENEVAIITRFGRPTGKPVTEAGLHMKIPFVEKVNRIDGRIREWDGQAVEMPTRDKLYIIVDSFGRWRISDPMLYFTRLRDTRSALSRMDDIVGSEMRNAVAKNDLIEMVRTDKARQPASDLGYSKTLATNETSIGSNELPAISRGRTAVEKELLDKAAVKLKEFGIDLVDVRFMRLNYHPSVTSKINERMISERAQIAARFRSEGEGEAAKILGNKNKDLAEITSAAYEAEQDIRGKADAKAAEIYARSYNQSTEAIELYNFLRTMDTYRKIATNDTTLIMSTRGDLFKYLKGSSPNATLAQPTK
jgi:membrane protease subunit HflC